MFEKGQHYFVGGSTDSHPELCDVCGKKYSDSCHIPRQEQPKPLLAEARSQAFRDAMAVYEPYIKLLIEEINELIPLAMVHGWKSSRYDAGIKCRKDIANLSGQLRGEGK